MLPPLQPSCQLPRPCSLIAKEVLRAADCRCCTRKTPYFFSRTLTWMRGRENARDFTDFNRPPTTCPSVQIEAGRIIEVTSLWQCSRRMWPFFFLCCRQEDGNGNCFRHRGEATENPEAQTAEEYMPNSMPPASERGHLRLLLCLMGARWNRDQELKR